MSWFLCTLRVAATPLFSAHSCWIKKNKTLFILFWGLTAVWDTFTLAAAEMSEEVKDKATGKSAHRKKKGKKVKNDL